MVFERSIFFAIVGTAMGMYQFDQTFHESLWLRWTLDERKFLYKNNYAEDSPLDPVYVQVGGETWLECLPPAVHVNQNWYMATDGTLKYISTRSIQGQDLIGSYVKVSRQWSAGGVPFVTTITSYKEPAMILFGQEFPEGADMTFTGNVQGTISGWPVISRKQLQADLGFVIYGGIMSGDTAKSVARWSDLKKNFMTGIYDGPKVLFDGGTNALIISPFDEFMSVSTAYNQTTSALSFGVMGNASHVPAGYKMHTMLFAGTEGINQAFKDWGILMRKQYGRTLKYTESDFTNNYLGYWMDGGAYYSYRTEPNKTAEDTVLDMKAQSLKQKVPYRYVEFDEWFYCQCEGEPVVGCCDSKGTLKWETADGVFPHGFKYVSDVTNWPVHASNKWWNSKTPYAKQNGGNFTFVMNEPNGASLPVDQCFWDYLMNLARERGQIVYEQDFESTQIEHLWQLTSNVTLGRTWYNQFGHAAQRNGIMVQLCMAPSRAILQALEIPAITQARASNDYRPGYDNWRIGMSSLLLNAVGIRPFKDNFWTTLYQPHYNFGNFNETHVDLGVLVATTSMGPVGPSDMINHTNPQKLMRCCNQNGLILQPSFPPTIVDPMIKQWAFIGIVSEIWSTASLVSGQFFGMVMGLMVAARTVLYPADVFSHLAEPSQLQNMMLYSNNVQLKGLTDINPFNSSMPLVVDTSCMPKTPCVYYTTPLFTVGTSKVALLGELSKWVPISPKRIMTISLTEDDLVLTLTGMASEVVEISAMVDKQVVTIKCTIQEWETVNLGVISGKCGTPL